MSITDIWMVAGESEQPNLKDLGAATSPNKLAPHTKNIILLKEKA